MALRPIRYCTMCMHNVYTHCMQELIQHQAFCTLVLLFVVDLFSSRNFNINPMFRHSFECHHQGMEWSDKILRLNNAQNDCGATCVYANSACIQNNNSSSACEQRAINFTRTSLRWACVEWRTRRWLGECGGNWGSPAVLEKSCLLEL